MFRGLLRARCADKDKEWIPAFAGMTEDGLDSRLRREHPSEAPLVLN